MRNPISFDEAGVLLILIDIHMMFLLAFRRDGTFIWGVYFLWYHLRTIDI